jgi:outer membrane immunogenic protein
MKPNKLLVIAGAGALWMAAVAPAGAADIPAAPVVKAPVMVPAKQSWYGFYIGVHGGYGWNRNAITATPDAFYTPFFIASGLPNTFAGDAKGFIGGITYGSNYQFDRIVVGFDSDFSFTDIKSSQTISGTVGGIPFTTNSSQKLAWFSTTRVRGGFLLGDNILLYATGGLANGRIEASSSNTVTIAGGCLIPGGCPTGGISQNKWGWAAGGGIEVASGPWQFRAEYLHYDLGTVSYFIRDLVVPAASIGANLKVSGDMVRGAITYRFNWTPLGLIFGTDKI